MKSTPVRSRFVLHACLGTALAMAYSGARGETGREMAAILKLDGPRAHIDAANKGLLQLFAGYDPASRLKSR